MTKAAQSILERAMALDNADRTELAEMLAGTLEPSTDPEYVAAWEDEIRRRIAEVESGAEKPIPWREAMEQIRRGEGAAEDV